MTRNNIFEEALKKNGIYRKQWCLSHIPMEALEGEVAYREGLLHSPPCRFKEQHAGSECR